MQINPMSLTLEELRALPESVRGKGIYFLWLEDEILYIGASTNVVDRVNRQELFRDYGHMGSPSTAAAPRIPFDKATIFKWEGLIEDMADMERKLIKKWRPPYNVFSNHHSDIRFRNLIANERAERKPK